MEKNDISEYRMGLFYLSGLLDESDFALIKSELNENGIKFNSLDRGGKPTASIEDFTNVYSFIITSPLAIGLVSGVFASAVWESVKSVILHTFRKIRGKTYNKITRDGVEKKDLTFGIEIKINDSHFNFNFKGVSSDESILEALDKILPFLREIKTQQKSSNLGLPDYLVTYDEKAGIWVARKADEIIKEKIEKSKPLYRNSKKT